MRRTLVAALILVSLSATGLFGCTKKLPPQYTPHALIDAELPPIRVNRIDVGPTSLKVEPGKPTVLALWATWCVPCREEIPALVHWSRMQEHTQLIVLNVDELSVDLTVIRTLAGEFGLDAPVLATTPAKASPLGLRALPVIYVMDAEGIVRAVKEGYEGVEAMHAWIAETVDQL